VNAAPTRRTPFDRALRALGSEFLEFGGWYWSTTFGDPVREHMAVRTAAGMWDQSPLPKWRVEGPDAVDALDFVFTNDIRRLKRGQVRYSPFCDDLGRMISDATIYKFSDQDFWVMPTLESDLEYVRRLVSHLDVSIESFTADLGLVDIQGPQSRDVLASLCDTDLGVLRYFHFWPEEVEVAGVPCWVSRTGYSGELGFEILCEPRYGDQLWNALLETGGLTPYGLSAVESIRIESGLLFIGIDYTPYETSPFDLSLDRFIAIEKELFNGREALAAAIAQPERRLCTLLLDTDEPPEYGATVLADHVPIGRLTSVCMSPLFRRVIGLAILDTETAKIGARVDVDTGAGALRATVAPLPYHDTNKTRPRL
jgi:aminomethyltransferase